MSNSTALELLAPAKNAEAGRLAINYGADAVYIGAEMFGARFKAGNSIQEIEKLIRYAHLYNAKVYITLNTLLFDDEMAQATKLAQKVYEAGADALIIQDMGLIEAGLPPLPLFASTQTHNYSLERIQFLEAAGFSRIILARELSLEEIQNIRQHTQVDLEFFIHGALCTAFSGQCYLSAAGGNRSGNRGDCSQLCRLPYQLSDANQNPILTNKHLLSLKDLNLSEHLQSLVEAGITSFKIEGRLKDVDYIQNIVSHYRKRLDDILLANPSCQKSSSGQTHLEFTPNPLYSFSRGFTSHFVEGRQMSQSSIHTPKSVGEPLGKVKSTGEHYFSLDTSHSLHNGDGIALLNAEGEFWGTSVNKVEGEFIYPNSMNNITKGCSVSRNYHKEFQHTLSKDESKRLISIRIEMGESENGFRLSATDEDNITSSLENSAAKEPALQAEKALATIEKQFMKAGNTIFAVEEVKLQLSNAYFIQVSVLNEMRRKLLSEHEAKRLETYVRTEKPIQPNDFPYPEKHLSFRGNVTNRFAHAFYKRHGVESIEDGFELNDSPADDIIFSSRYCIKFELGRCPKQKPILPAMPEPWSLSDHKNKYRLSFDCKRCVMNVHLRE
ncbi:MAG: U32 family peptidase [Bacteroidota bacterium]